MGKDVVVSLILPFKKWIVFFCVVAVQNMMLRSICDIQLSFKETLNSQIHSFFPVQYSLHCIKATKSTRALYVLVFGAISITIPGREYCPWPIILCVILNLKIFSFSHPCQKKKIKDRLIFSVSAPNGAVSQSIIRQLFTGVAWIFQPSLHYPPNVLSSKDYNLQLTSF